MLTLRLTVPANEIPESATLPTIDLPPPSESNELNHPVATLMTVGVGANVSRYLTQCFEADDSNLTALRSTTQRRSDTIDSQPPQSGRSVRRAFFELEGCPLIWHIFQKCDRNPRRARLYRTSPRVLYVPFKADIASIR